MRPIGTAQLIHVKPAACAAVVRNGYQPAREVETGIGPVPVRVPKVRSRTGQADAASLEVPHQAGRLATARVR